MLRPTPNWRGRNATPNSWRTLRIVLEASPGKRILDLGGGPGQYSVLFAQRGADVTWHDVSREYESIARERAAAAGVTFRFSLGYLEDAQRFREQPFDLVFCRVCWYYARSDRAFSRQFYSLIKPGGVGYVECNTPAFSQPTGWRRLQYWLNQNFWFKVGHPMPPHGRIARLLQRRSRDPDGFGLFFPLRDIVVFAKSRTRLEKRSVSDD